VVLLNLGLPELDGLEVCRRVRAWSDVPIIVLSVRDDDTNKVAALDLGADDYLTKPFSTSELLARVKVALRHAARNQTARAPTLRIGELQIDFAQRWAKQFIVSTIGYRHGHSEARRLASS